VQECIGFSTNKGGSSPYRRSRLFFAKFGAAIDPAPARLRRRGAMNAIGDAIAEAPVAPPDLRLTARGLLRLELFPPPADLAPYVTTFFRMRSEEQAIRDVQPSSIGLLGIMARGSPASASSTGA
jgi:hypothetical protein